MLLMCSQCSQNMVNFESKSDKYKWSQNAGHAAHAPSKNSKRINNFAKIIGYLSNM